jgi:pulmonary surfactant-associated protein A
LFCGDWKVFGKEKCIKNIDMAKFLTFSDAEKTCTQLSNGSSLITIHSEEEQEFLLNFVFKTNKVIDNVWLGLKRTGNDFKWTDGSELNFTNWIRGKPSNRTDSNCVQMLLESNPRWEWADEPCSKKGLVVCQKIINSFISTSKW